MHGPVSSSLVKPTGKREGTDSATLREQVMRVRAEQSSRNGGPLKPNALLTGRELDDHVALDEDGKFVLKQAMTEMGLSARAYDKVRRVARTIADMEQATHVAVQHVAEAVVTQRYVRQSGESHDTHLPALYRPPGNPAGRGWRKTPDCDLKAHPYSQRDLTGL